MEHLNRSNVVRLLLTLGILLSGLALLPFVKLQAAPIDWTRLAGVYTPELAVNEPEGAPGSVFAFTGTNYPPNSVAAVYVNGVWLGTVMTDGDGVGRFMLDTAGAAIGGYAVTMEVDINASAHQTVALVSDGQVVTPPDGFPGPVFNTPGVIYLPAITRP